MIKKLSMVALIILMTVTLVACGGNKGKTENGTTSDRIVKLGINLSNAQTLDVWHTSFNSVFQISDAIFDRLLDKDPQTLELKCNLLEDFPAVSDDGKTYTFKLKKGVKFHDGTELTAKDVEFTFNYFYAKDTASTNTWVLDAIKGCKAMMDGTADHLEGFKVIDDHTFVIELEYPYAAFQSILAVSMLPILPKDARLQAGDDWGMKTLIGSGPYKLKSFSPAEKVELEVNPDYHGKVPNVDGIEMTNMDSSTALLEWEAGNIDICNVPSELVEKYQQSYPNNFVKQPVVGTTRLQLNPTIPPLDDVRVRQAIQLGINRADIVSGYFKDNVTILNGVIPNGIPGYNADAKDLEYNPEKAKKLLAEAGYADGLELTATIKESSVDWKQVQQIIAEQLSKVGITMNIEQVDAGTFFDRRNANNIAVFLSDWFADYIDGDMYMYSLFHSKYSGQYSNGLNDSWYDEQVENARVMTDPKEREELYKKLDDYLVNDVHNYVPLYQEADFSLRSDRVKGVFMKKDLLFTFADASIS